MKTVLIPLIATSLVALCAMPAAGFDASKPDAHAVPIPNGLYSTPILIDGCTMGNPGVPNQAIGPLGRIASWGQIIDPVPECPECPVGASPIALRPYFYAMEPCSAMLRVKLFSAIQDEAGCDVPGPRICSGNAFVYTAGEGLTQMYVPLPDDCACLDRRRPFFAVVEVVVPGTCLNVGGFGAFQAPESPFPSEPCLAYYEETGGFFRNVDLALISPYQQTEWAVTLTASCCDLALPAASSTWSALKGAWR